jgi:very-short-patch-repair endonuclease
MRQNDWQRFIGWLVYDRGKNSMTKKKQDEYRASPMQILLGIHLRELGFLPEYEHHFCERDWRFDVACPRDRLAFEISGGQFTGGHRTGFWGKLEATRRKAMGKTGTPQEEEYDKLNTAQLLGWRVFQFTNEQVSTGRAKAFLEEWLQVQISA